MFFAHALFSLGLLAAQDVPAPAPVQAAPEAAEASPEAVGPQLIKLPEGVAASAPAAEGEPTQISFAELDPLLIRRHAKRPEGKDILGRLINMQVLRRLAADAGIQITPAVLDARIAEIDQQLRDGGYAGGIAEQLALGDIDPQVFRETLGVSLAQEELTRIALQMEVGERPDAGAQNAWMDEIIAGRTLVLTDSPFPTSPDAIVALSDDVEVPMALFNKHMRDELPRQFVEQAISQLVLLKRTRALAGKIDPAIWKEACNLEIESRRTRHTANPETMGVAFEALLDAQGLSIDMLLQDPSVQITALTTLLAWRQSVAAAGPEMADSSLAERRTVGLKNLYNQEKELFDGYYGEQLRLFSLLLQAIEVPTEKVPRSTQDARDYLVRLAPGIPDLAGFQLMVEKLSDDANAPRNKGELGWFGAGNEMLPEELRKAAFAQWLVSPQPGPLGPLDVPGGVALFWIADHRDAPEWKDLAFAVQSELQARHLNEVMPQSGIQIFRDPPLATK